MAVQTRFQVPACRNASRGTRNQRGNRGHGRRRNTDHATRLSALRCDDTIGVSRLQPSPGQELVVRATAGTGLKRRPIVAHTKQHNIDETSSHQWRLAGTA
jgi:hypothetical protein